MDSSNKKKPSVNLLVSLILLVVYLLTWLVDIFTAKQITLSSLLLCIGALLVFVGFLRKIKSRYYLGILFFTFFAQYLGAMLKFYTIIPIYDLLLHFASGSLLVLLADYMYTLLLHRHKDYSIPTVIRLTFCGLASIASAAVWEIWEYSGDKLIGLQSQGNLDDTMTDIVAGSIGAILGVLALWYIIRMEGKKKNK